MSDSDRLPMKMRQAFNNLSTASDAVRNMSLVYNPDWITIYQQFLGDALPGEWGAAKTNGTAAAVSVASSQLTCTSGTDNDGYAGQGFGLFWKGDNGIYMESEQALDVITTAKLEVGLTDSIADAGAVNAKATPTGTADDFCVIVFDTDDNTQMDIISELDNGGPAANAENIHTLVAATNFTTIFTAQNDDVDVKIGSSVSNATTAGSGSMQGGDLMSPWWFAQTRTTASRVLTVEYAFVTGPAA